MSDIKVVHVLSSRWADVPEERRVYIGRQNAAHNLYQSIWHNPIKIAKGASRSERCQCVADYCKHLLSRRELWLKLADLEGMVLGCWCKGHDLGGVDLECHGDALAKIVSQLRAHSPLFESGQINVPFTQLVIETYIAIYEQMAEEWRRDEETMLTD